jgi:hypothetical protein
MFGSTKAHRNYYILIISVMSMWITVSTIYMVLPSTFRITAYQRAVMVS